MEHGRIVGYGTYRELLASGHDFHAETEDEDPAETATSTTPEGCQGSHASAVVSPVESAAASGVADGGGGLTDEATAKLGQHPKAADRNSAAAILRKGDFVKVCWAAQQPSALGPRVCGVVGAEHSLRVADAKDVHVAHS